MSGFHPFFLLLMVFAILIKTYKIKCVPNYFCKWILMILVPGVTLPVYTFIDGNRSKLACNYFTYLTMQAVEYFKKLNFMYHLAKCR